MIVLHRHRHQWRRRMRGSGNCSFRLAALWLAAFLTVACAEGHAEIKRFVAVSYLTASGFADPVVVEVTFATGAELLSRSYNPRLSYSKAYAIVWFAQDQAAVLEIDEIVVTSTMDSWAFRHLFLIKDRLQARQVNDGVGRIWMIQAKHNFAWIDPRADQP